MMSLSFLSAEAGASFEVPPAIVETAKASQRGFAATGATAGAAVCVATGLGTAAAPICAAVGGWLGENLAKALSKRRASNAGDARYKEKLSANAAAAEYYAELKRIRDEALTQTINGLVQFGKQNGWSQANPTDVAVQLQKLGANISNIRYDVFNQLPAGVIDFRNLGAGGPYFSGPMPCSMSPVVCPSGGCQFGRVYDINMAYVRCTEDETNKWAGGLEVAATYLGAAILDKKAPGQINFTGPKFSLNNSESKVSTPVKLAAGAAAVGGGWWLLTKLGWL